MFSEDDVLAALPARGFLREYVNYAMRCTDAHAAYHLGTGLAALAQTCPLDLSFPFGVPIHVNIYALCVGPSGMARKSGSIAVARDLLEDAIPSSLGEQPGSREALVDNLRACPRQVISYPEFGNFLSAVEKGYLTPLKTAYVEAWDGSALGRSLVRQRQGTEAKPRLSLMAGCTLDYLERHTESADWTGGFMARFVTFYATRKRTYTVPTGDVAGKIDLVGHLKELNETFLARGHCLGFDARARKMWDDWYHWTEQCGGAAEIAGAIARSPTQALKIAVMLAWDYGGARSGQHWYVTEAELGPAVAITKFHIDSVTRIGESLAPTRDMRDRRAVLAAVRPYPRTVGEITKDSKLLLRRVKEILETLLEEKTIVNAALGTKEVTYVLARRQTVPEADARPDAKILHLPVRSSSSGGPNGAAGEPAPLVLPSSDGAAPVAAAPVPLTWDDPPSDT